MKILGIETSCDETGAAVIEESSGDISVKLLSNSLATSLVKHAETGGIIPEIAAREQVKFILPVIKEALSQANLAISEKPDIDAIAVTYGPGLIGSLLVGVETAKTLAYLWGIPIIPVNHMYGHIYANFVRENLKFEIRNSKLNIPSFPAIALVVSGGHTDLVLLKAHGELEVLGGTRDDAAGECFDKVGRLLGLNYPAGPVISKWAESGDPKRFPMPRPMWDSKDYDFSFSGLKTHVLNLIKKNGWRFDNVYSSNNNEVSHKEEFLKKTSGQNNGLIADLCAGVQKAIIDVLVFKTLNAVKEYEVKSLLLGGGVAANKALSDRFYSEIKNQKLEVSLHIPPAFLCTDNAAMIASAGFYNRNLCSWRDVIADPELYY